MPAEPPESHGHQALALLDRILSQAPDPDASLFSPCTISLVALREAMIAERRRTGYTAEQNRRLEHVNAIISVVMAGHFPLGPIPWKELKKARAWLKDLLRPA
jgi:hypothetical protein